MNGQCKKCKSGYEEVIARRGYWVRPTLCSECATRDELRKFLRKTPGQRRAAERQAYQWAVGR